MQAIGTLGRWSRPRRSRSMLVRDGAFAMSIATASLAALVPALARHVVRPIAALAHQRTSASACAFSSDCCCSARISRCARRF